MGWWGRKRKKHGEKTLIISDDGFGIRSSDVKSKGGVVNDQWPVSASSVEVLLRGSLTSRISNKQVTSCLYTREAYVFCNKMKLNKHLVNNNYYYYSCHYREGYGRVVAVVVKWTRF